MLNRMKILKRTVSTSIFLFCAMSSALLFAQLKYEARKQFRTISIEEGLSQSTVYSIVQDSLGFVWMGTQDGLNRYDGGSFQVYRPIKKDQKSIESSYIRSLFIDHKGVLWIGGNKGISSFDYVTESFKNYRLKVKSGEWFVTSINHTENGDIWLATSSGELYVYNKKADSFHLIDLQTYNVGINNIWNIARLDNQFLLGTDIGVFQFNPVSKKISRFGINNKSKVNYIFVDKQFVWAGTEGKGLFQYDRVGKSVKQYLHTAGEPSKSIADNDVRSVERDEFGNLWIGTFKGLSIMNLQDGTIQNYFHQSSVPYTLSQNSVRYIYRDKQNGMWMGTFYGGVSYYHNDDVRFSFLNRNTGNLSLNDHVVNVIKEDPNKNIWIGTNDKGLNFWDRKKGIIKYYSHSESDVNSLASNNIKAIEFDRFGHVLIGTHNAGLSYFDPNTGRTLIFRHKADDGASIAGDMVYALLRDKQGNIWVGTRSGLDRFNEVTKSFSHIYLDKRGTRLSSDEITTLEEDSKGRIWIGTTNGVNILYPDQMLFETFMGDKLSNDVVTSIVEDKKGRIWVATRDGLNLYNDKSKKFAVYKDQKNIIKGIVYGITCDDDGNIWLSLSRNLLKFNPDKNLFQLFDIKDGLQNNQFNLSAVSKTSDGMLLFGGINGLTYFYPKDVTPKKMKLDLTFTGMEVLNRPVFVGDAHDILNQHIDKQETLKLNHDHKQFTISFNTFNYISPNKIKYLYQLEGFDHEWQEVTAITKVTYTNLKAGNYIFKVKAVGPLGESSKERTLKIKILPPWWKSNWFFLIITACCIGGIYAAYSIVSERMRTLHQLKMERLQREYTTNKLNLERMEREKMDSINKMKTDFFTNISHEFRTPLTLMIAPLEELMANKLSERTTKKYHELILLNTKRLLNLVDQLLEFRKTEAGTRKLKLAKGDIVSFIHDVYSSFVVLSEKNGIKYSFKSTESRLPISFDKDAIEKICFNLLSNAFKYTPKGGVIEINLSKNAQEIQITVSDTGIGIDINEQQSVFNRFYQVDNQEMNLGSGVGLAFTKKLVELHGGYIELNSKKGEGAVFAVNIPIVDSDTVDSYSAEEFSLVVENTVDQEDIELDGDLETEQRQEQKEKLLVVDDNYEIVDFLSSHLNKYQVAVAYNGKQALDILENDSFDLIISDVMMPEIDGIQLCKKIKQNINTCHIPVILLTAKNETQHQIKGLEAGADDYVTKPFSMSLLTAKVQSILKSRRRLKEFYSESKEIVPENIAFNTLDEEFLRQAIVTIEKHLSDSDFSVDKFSREVGMSRSNLYLKLKAITGESATDFIKRIRFKKAVELLVSKQYTVAQVAYMCGFNSPSYFSTAFKQYYDCMPTEYLAKKADGE
ncbi:histidine kinase [Pseudopedobacter saltans DSM 12145]|uniref:histidine kinase n=2 Tax=Pseudopedobacter saltans TaxID=151895 RepID=F0S8A2_PSESL|nr:histidine kinase [Pseudopedobacter saltans DSM 12145]